MIAAYAQASDRQGLDGAVDGRAVAIEDVHLTALRARGAALNLRAKQHVSGNVDVRRGRKILRLELQGNEDDAATRSPIVVVLEIKELRAGGGTVVRRVMDTITAIERQCDPTEIAAGVDAALHMSCAGRTRATVGVASVVLFVLIAIAFVRVVRTSLKAGRG